MKNAKRFFQSSAFHWIDVKHFPLSGLQPMFIDFIHPTYMPKKQFFWLNTPIFHVAYHIAAYTQPFAKFSLR